jgi:tubulin polyglutamylase TTLL6/13
MDVPSKYYSPNVKQPEDSMCFEILGFDILIDHKLKPWLIEINSAPSFATDTPLDFKLKKDVIADCLQILNLSSKKKH